MAYHVVFSIRTKERDLITPSLRCAALGAIVVLMVTQGSRYSGYRQKVRELRKVGKFLGPDKIAGLHVQLLDFSIFFISQTRYLLQIQKNDHLAEKLPKWLDWCLALLNQQRWLFPIHLQEAETETEPALQAGWQMAVLKSLWLEAFDVTVNSGLKMVQTKSSSLWQFMAVEFHVLHVFTWNIIIHTS